MRTRPGSPYPLGATWDGEGVNFAIFSQHATSVELCLYENDTAPAELIRIPLQERTNRVFHVYLPDVRPGQLFGYRVDGVVVNRIFPDDGGDDWRAGWVSAQKDVLARVSESFAGLPLWRSIYRSSEPIGVDALQELAREVYADSDPLAQPAGTGPFRVTRTASGAVLHLALPHVSRDDVDLARHGDELVVSVASYRRLLTLPPGLGRHQVAGARVVGGELQVRFEEGTS